MSKNHHFIHIKELNLLYGRVPKVANTSIKAVLCRLLTKEPDNDIKTTSDRFWRDSTHQQTELLSPGQARKLRSTHFSFSFVRNLLIPNILIVTHLYNMGKEVFYIIIKNQICYRKISFAF